MKEKNKKFIESIISANNDNSLAIFVGAGISKSSETNSVKLPTWYDLIKDFKTDLEIENENDFLKIAQLYYLKFGEFEYYKKLKEYFHENISPSIIHKLIFDINPHVIITTNWDNILDKTITDNAYIYDIICSDKDLVKSSIQNKLIKMHGDFKNHNIVFKEDDYLKYSQSFPLIENYVKSILSTHTIVFIGYSYNDINLKQIVKWIQNRSNVKPPMYLVTDDNNNTQIKYLENYGITTIVMDEKDDKIFQIDEFLDEYSKKIYTFLTSLSTKNESYLITNTDDPEEFILNKLQTLNELESILLEQIKKTLINCIFIYDSDSFPILEFIDENSFYNINKSLQGIYKSFIEKLKDIDQNKQKPSSKILKIFEILQKARIKGILISTDNNNIKNYIHFQDDFKSKEPEEMYNNLNFCYKLLPYSSSDLNEILDTAFKLYNLNKLEEAFQLTENAVTICLKQRNYTKLFISMFNRNLLLDMLKNSINNIESNDKYKKIIKYDINEKYFNLPKNLKIVLEPIYEFVNLNFIYKYTYNIFSEKIKYEQDKRNIELGGSVFFNKFNESSSMQESLIKFVLKNKIMIEDYSEFKLINKIFVEIALIRQFQNETITLSKTELFSCIQYINHKELCSLLEVYYKEDSPIKAKFEISNDLKNWLIFTVLENLITNYLATKNFKFDAYIQNTLFILSLLNLENDSINHIFEIICNFLNKKVNSLNILEAINDFILIQHYLYIIEINHELLINFIEIMIKKLIDKNCTSSELHSIKRTYYKDIYSFMISKEIVFENEDLIDYFLSELKKYSISDKIEITQHFIYVIYQFSNIKIKNKIKDFTLSIDINEELEVEKRIIFDFYLAKLEFKEISTELKQLTIKYLEQFKDEKKISPYFNKLNDIIKYLILQKNVNGLKEINETIESIINRYKEYKRENKSIF